MITDDNSLHSSYNMRTFFIIWFGQLVSMVGTAMTTFGLITWAYQQTGEATTLALLGFFSMILFVLVSPVAGVLVDRWDRRKVMILADLGAGVLTTGLIALHLTDSLAIWHLYISGSLFGAFGAFQTPAYRATTSLIVPKAQFGRANGLRSLALALSEVAAPFLAGLVLLQFDLLGVLLVDLLTFSIAMFTLMIVHIPRPPKVTVVTEETERFHRQIAYGFRFIRARRGLLGLLIIYMGINLMAAITWFGVINAMILARTDGNELALATVLSATGAGAVVGGLAVSVWGGPKKRIHGVFGYGAISFLLGDFMLGAGQSVLIWSAAGFIASYFIPFIVSADRTIWQLKTPPDVQGRVFSVVEMLRTGTMPIGYLIAGPLADLVFEPAMQPDGVLSSTFGWLVGTGPGAGMGLMFVCTATLGMLVSASGYLFPFIRNVERDLPDFELDPSPDDTPAIAPVAV